MDGDGFKSRLPHPVLSVKMHYVRTLDNTQQTKEWMVHKNAKYCRKK